MATTSVRLPDEVLRGLDALADAGHTDRAVVLRKAIERGLRDLRLDQALETYQRGEGSLAWCAQKAEVSLWDLLDEMQRRRLGLATDEDHLLAQVEALE